MAAECDCFMGRISNAHEYTLHSMSCPLIIREYDETRAIRLAQDFARITTPKRSPYWYNYLENLENGLMAYVPANQ